MPRCGRVFTTEIRRCSGSSNVTPATTEKGGRFVVHENWFPSVVVRGLASLQSGLASDCESRRGSPTSGGKRREIGYRGWHVGTGIVKARERKGRERGVTSFPINNKQIGHYPKSMPGEQPGHENPERDQRTLLFPKSVRHAARFTDRLNEQQIQGRKIRERKGKYTPLWVITRRRA